MKIAESVNAKSGSAAAELAAEPGAAEWLVGEDEVRALIEHPLTRATMIAVSTMARTRTVVIDISDLISAG